MKITLFLATAASLAIAVTGFAKAPETANVKAQQQLTTDFKDAGKVTWSAKASLMEASFEWNGQKLHTFYNQDGDQVAISREVSMDKLPIKAIQSINANYSGYKAGEAIELSNDEGLSYYLAMENGNKKVILNVSSNGQVSVFK